MLDSYLGAITWFWGALQILPSRFGSLEELSSTNVELHQSHAKYVDDWQNNRNFLNFLNVRSAKTKRRSKIMAYSNHISDAEITYNHLIHHMLHQKLHHSPSSIRSSVCRVQPWFYFVLSLHLAIEMQVRVDQFNWQRHGPNVVRSFWHVAWLKLYIVRLYMTWWCSEILFGGAYQLGTRICFFPVFGWVLCTSVVNCGFADCR